MRTFKCECCSLTLQAIATEAWCSCTTRRVNKRTGKAYGRSGHPLMVLVSTAQEAVAA